MFVGTEFLSTCCPVLESEASHSKKQKTKALIRIRAIKLFLSVYFSLFCLEDAPQPVCLLCCVYYSAAWRDEVFGAPTLTEALSRFSLRSQVMNVRLIRRNME